MSLRSIFSQHFVSTFTYLKIVVFNSKFQIENILSSINWIDHCKGRSKFSLKILCAIVVDIGCSLARLVRFTFCVYDFAIKFFSYISEVYPRILCVRPDIAGRP